MDMIEEITTGFKELGKVRLFSPFFPGGKALFHKLYYVFFSLQWKGNDPAAQLVISV